MQFLKGRIVLRVALRTALRLYARQRVENDKTRVLDRLNPIGNCAATALDEPPASRSRLQICGPLISMDADQLSYAGLQPALAILAGAVEHVAMLDLSAAETRAILRCNRQGSIEGQPGFADFRPADQHRQTVGHETVDDIRYRREDLPLQSNPGEPTLVPSRRRLTP